MLIQSKLLDIFNYPINKLKSIWKVKTPKQKWNGLYQFVRLAGDLLQIRVLSTQRNGPLGYFPLGCIFIQVTFFIYTFYFYAMRGTLYEIIPSCCILGVTVSMYIPYFTSIMSSTKYTWHRLTNVSGNNIYRDNDQPTAYNRVCSSSIDDSVKTYMITIITVVLSFFGAILGPIYKFLNDGTLATLYELRVPFCNEYPRIEFYINVGWQVAISSICAFGLFLLEGLFALINNAIIVSANISALELDELSDELENQLVTFGKISKQLKMIFMRIMYMDEFISTFGNLMYWRHFFTPPFLTFSSATSIYSQYMLDYPAGYGLSVVSYIQMAIICNIGQTIDNRNLQLGDALYNFKWYLLPKKDQKELLFMMSRMQNGVYISIGPFQRLNFEALKILTQKVYTLIMLLVSYAN